MQSANKIYAFFIFLALLFWNPLTLYLIYGSTPAYEGWVLRAGFLLILVAGILCMWLTVKGRIPDIIKNIVMILSFAGIMFSFLVMADSLLGQVAGKQEKENKGLIFEPGSTVSFHTREFSYRATINSLGLRDREIQKDKGRHFRILCFGDSWTFGWGVEAENSWPAKLEKFLHENGFPDAEVINCGQGGQYPTGYREHMEKAIPVLKPDLVIAGILEAEDLAQLYEFNFVLKNKGGEGKGSSLSLFSRIRQSLKAFVKVSFHSFLTLRKRNTEVNTTWKQTARSTIDGFTDLQRIRYYTLDETERSLFESGDLNPGLLNWYINFPDRITVFNTPSNPAARFAIRELDKEISRMKAICKENKCTFVFANMPMNYFNGHQVTRTPADVVNPWLESNNKVDSVYASMAAKFGLPYIEFTGYFRSLEDKKGYYYQYDGHPNSKGYEAIAGYIGRQLMDQKLIQK